MWERVGLISVIRFRWGSNFGFVNRFQWFEFGKAVESEQAWNDVGESGIAAMRGPARKHCSQ